MTTTNKTKKLGISFERLMGINGMLDDQPTNTTTNAEVKLNLSDIDANSQQPRTNFDEDALRELSESIAIHGVIQPIVVTPVGTRYMIIAGERRFRASKLAGLTTIPAIIRNYTQQQIKEISLIENLQREDLNPVETARAIRTLMTEFNLTQEMAADRIGKSRPSVANTLRLLSLDDQVLDLVVAGRLSAGHARTLVVVPLTQQYKLALKASDNQMSVREMEAMVKNFLNPKPKKVTTPACLELTNLVDNMQRTFATKVSAVGNNNKGRIYIDYFTQDDLDRMCQLIGQWMDTEFNEN